jgi:aminopeptidase N
LERKKGKKQKVDRQPSIEREKENVSNMTKEVQDARLDRAFTPKHYDLAYQTIDLVRHTFQGTVQIHLEPNNHAGKQHKPGKSITLHALELNLLSATLVKQGKEKDAGTSISSKAVEFRYVKASQTCEIVFENDIVSSSPTMESSSKEEGYEYCLTIDFMGILNNDMRGLYRSMYKGLDGTMRTMATTQFEATDARRAFPCFDEPALKATFSLQVTMPRGLECISNTPIVSQHTYTTTNNSNDGPALLVTTTTFGKTPLMSTYLLALVIGEFDVITTTSETTKIQTSVYTVPGKAHQGQFCLDVATKCLDLYAQLFDVPYPLTKSDLLAIPDFAAGAMEVSIYDRKLSNYECHLAFLHAPYHCSSLYCLLCSLLKKHSTYRTGVASHIGRQR